MTSFNQLIAENNNDPQWITMIQSLLNYKQKLVEREEKIHVVSFAQNKTQIRKLLLCNYKVHTIHGVQFIRVSHLTEVLNRSKLLKRDVENGFVKLNTVVEWVYENNEKIKKTWLKKVL